MQPVVEDETSMDMEFTHPTRWNRLGGPGGLLPSPASHTSGPEPGGPYPGRASGGGPGFGGRYFLIKGASLVCVCGGRGGEGWRG